MDYPSGECMCEFAGDEHIPGCSNYVAPERPPELREEFDHLAEQVKALEEANAANEGRDEALSPAVAVPQPTLQDMIREYRPTKKVLLATPTNRGLTSQFVASMLNTMGDERMMTDQVQIQPYIWPGESLITRARNDILRHFYYETDCTHLFFIDDDIAWEPICFFDILAAEKDVVGGIYALKMLRWDKLVGQTIQSEEQAKIMTMEIVVNGAQADHHLNEGPLVVCHDLGTGFMCITREAIDKMVAAYPDSWYASNARGDTPKKTLNFFDTMYDGEVGTMKSTLLSEDYAFCRRWQALGEVCYVHTGIPLLTHIGTHQFGRITS